MPGVRKCIFGCHKGGPVYTLPKDDTIRKQWMDFIFGKKTPPKKRCYVCVLHFNDNCFLNKSLFESGLITKLTLKNNAVPTWKSTPSQPLPIPPVAIPKGPITYNVSARSVATQLSLGTLRFHHFRSRGVQASLGTEQSVKGSRPSKRPRLELEEEGDDLNYSTSSQESAVDRVDTATDLPDLIDLKSPDFEGAKYIVFESCLRELFDNCPVCQKHCIVDQQICGTLVAYSQKCPHCSFARKWQSQPMQGGVPQGNLELSAAVYFSGGSYEKIESICNTINLKVHQSDAFKRHARDFLEPAIYHKWKTDQNKLLEEAKRKGKVAVTGDMRAHSPGPSAKFASYAMMEFEDEKILDIQLLQSNEVGSRVNMETEGLKRCLDLLESNSVKVDSIVIDRHPQVEKYLQERDMSHYYDVWHVAKGLSKKLDALAKRQDCEVVQKWVPGIKNHMFWTASSSKTGAEKVAKWTSLVNHIQDVHEHDDPLYPKCAHPIKVSTDRKKWFKPGSVALKKVKKMILNKRILEDVYKLSSNHQSSALESFHNLILHFAPKKINFPFTGMLCRLYLAAMHHNENAKREQALSKEKLLWKLLLPNSTDGQASAKVMKQEATFGYRRDLMHLVLNDVFGDPKKFQKELQKVPVPTPPRAEGPSQEDIVAVKVSRVNAAVAGSQQAETPHSSQRD